MQALSYNNSVMRPEIIVPVCEQAPSLVAICTKDRPELLARALSAIAGDRPKATVIVVDASPDDRSKDVCAAARAANPGLDVAHYRAARPGLARQRNEAAQISAKRGAKIVHFLDDDAIVYPGYFDAIEDCFNAEPGVGGVGGAVQNPPPELHARFNRLFLLSGRYPYTVAKSGRVVSPHTLSDVPWALTRRDTPPVQWLQGFAMSYRIEVLNQMKFNERLQGYSYGEDRDFSFRVGSAWGLAIAHQAKCEHRKATNSRMDSERFGFESTVLTYAWMSEWRTSGHFSRVAYFWSAIGDVIRHLGAAVTRKPGISGKHPLGHVHGVIRGIATILRGGDLYQAASGR